MPDDDELKQRIRERAYHLWQADGGPIGNDLEYWERARALIGMESNPAAGQLPNPVEPGEDRPRTVPGVEEAFLQENLGEFPGRLTDQGEDQPTPVAPAPKKAAARRRTKKDA
jgi:hypothetical protein